MAHVIYQVLFWGCPVFDPQPGGRGAAPGMSMSRKGTLHKATPNHAALRAWVRFGDLAEVWAAHGTRRKLMPCSYQVTRRWIIVRSLTVALCLHWPDELKYLNCILNRRVPLELGLISGQKVT